MDREIAGRQRVTRLTRDQRLLAIAIPEHLETNAHLHCAIDLTNFYAKFASPVIAERRLNELWQKASRSASPPHVTAITSGYWGNYMAKKSDKFDPSYFISTDFHPY
jgi:hypothetical protein